MKFQGWSATRAEGYARGLAQHTAGLLLADGAPVKSIRVLVQGHARMWRVSYPTGYVPPEVLRMRAGTLDLEPAFRVVERRGRAGFVRSRMWGAEDPPP